MYTCKKIHIFVFKIVYVLKSGEFFLSHADQLSKVCINRKLSKEDFQCLKKQRKDKAMLISQSRVSGVLMGAICVKNAL